MQSLESLRGKYEINLGDRELEKSVIEVKVLSKLDHWAEVQVRCALNFESVSKIKFSAIPTELSLRWQGSGVFKGFLMGVEMESHSVLSFTFYDAFYLASTRYENEFIKKQSIGDCLKKLSSKLGMSGQFYGNFNETISGFSLSGKNIYECLLELAEKYGFFMNCDSFSKKLNFIRLGNEIRSNSVDLKEKSISVSSIHSVSQMFSKVKLGYHNPEEGKTQDKTFSGASLYSILGPYKGGSSFGQKSSWKLSEGEINTSVSDFSDFERADALVKNQICKEAISQEKIQITSFEKIGFPGEAIQIENAVNAQVQSGKYLILQSELTVQGAIAVGQITAMRA